MSRVRGGLRNTSHTRRTPPSTVPSTGPSTVAEAPARAVPELLTHTPAELLTPPPADGAALRPVVAVTVPDVLPAPLLPPAPPEPFPDQATVRSGTVVPVGPPFVDATVGPSPIGPPPTELAPSQRTPVVRVAAAGGAPRLDDLIPASRMPSRRDRRRRGRTRLRWGSLGALVLVMIVALAAWGLTADDGGAPERAITGHGRPHRSGTTRSTVASGDAPTPTSTTPKAGAGDPPVVGGAVAPPAATAPTPQTVPDPSVNVEPTAGDLQITPTAGACRWDPDAEELVSSGTVRNVSGSEVSLELEVTWTDASGELDSWSDVFDLAPGESQDWDMSTPWSDEPSGLQCTPSVV